MKRISIILLALLPFVGISQSGYQINGNVDVDQNIWQPLVYLSIIETFEDMSTVSPAMVFDDATLDENGRFVFNGEFLPTGERIYRLHLRKWDDPLSTIIIGGNEHNHLHFAMSPGDTIRINSGQRVFGEATIIGGESNDCIQEAYRMAEMRFDAGGMSDNYSMREERAARGLIDIVESCPAQLGSLFSAFKILQKFDDTDEAARLPEVLNDKSYSESVYTKEVMAWKSMKFPEAEVKDASSPRAILWGLLLVVIAAIGLGAGVFYRKSNEGLSSAGEEVLPDPIDDLSIQERKVLQLIADGLTNKEIASALNIEVNTVKSHVSRIYKKLRISSRKEVRRFMDSDRIGVLTS